MLPDFDAPVDRPRHPAALTLDELLPQCSEQHSRTGGPGGQRRNKVETAVQLTHTPTGIAASASERRSVHENRPVAIRRLRLALAIEVRANVPAGDIRSPMWRMRCQKGRIACSPTHWDYPAMLAEALDVIDASGFDMSRAAVRLECTPSQLLKLIREHPPVWAWLNRNRESRGQHGFK